MCGEVVTATKYFVTHFTLFVYHVNSHMSSEITFTDEPIIANFTYVSLLTRVGFHMCVEVESATKYFVTQFTLISSFTAVCRHV